MTEPLHIRVPCAVRCWLTAGVAVALLLGWAGGAHAQAPAQLPPGQAVVAPGGPGAPPAAAPAGGRLQPGDIGIRIFLPLLDQLAFTVHPFYQITGDPGYLGAKAASVSLLRVGGRGADARSSSIARAIHALPPFGIEGVMGIDLAFPRGIGFGFDFSPLSQNDTEAAQSGSVLPIKMDTFIYGGTLRFYVFNPNEPGVNYFLGLGLGLIEGNIRADPFAGQASEYVAFSQFPAGSTRMGLEGRGDNWGFRYEIMILNADQVKLAYNPYTAATGVTKTTIDFSGTLMRLAVFYQF
jgi:hypothetical protein